MLMLAVTGGVAAGLLSFAALVLAGTVAAIGQIYVAVVNRRQTLTLADIKAPTGDNYTRTIEGFTKLLEAQSRRLDEQDERIEELEGEVKAARRESRAAAIHVADCERELRAARERLTLLENGQDG